MSERRSAAFSYAVKVGHVAANPLTVRMAADAAERAALADLWGVESVESFEAELQLTRWKRDGVRVKGEFHAELTQACVVTLEPVKATLDEPVEALFVPEGSRLARIDVAESGEVIVDPDGPDMPETFSGDTIDVGAVVSEFAALAIDPYPRAPDATLSQQDPSVTEADEHPSAFDALRDWRPKDE